MSGELKHSHVRKVIESWRTKRYSQRKPRVLGFFLAIITLLHNLAIYIIKPINIQNTSR